MVNLEYLEQLVDSIDKAISNLESASDIEKEKIKNFVSSISNEINKILIKR